ncbi:MAG: hypothetical protein M3Z26_07990 [Bacteroidota bacterium]|nr:hypothetical protein [Bacteroidota bacterium]
MALLEGTTYLQRLKNRYRLVVTNEDTFEEVVAFKLNRWSVYVAMSVLFILLVGLTIALIAFTPLKLYIPGYGSAGKTQEFEALKLKSDSIERNLVIKQQYINDIEKVLKGNILPADTTMLKVSDIDKSPVPKKRKRRRR